MQSGKVGGKVLDLGPAVGGWRLGRSRYGPGRQLGELGADRRRSRRLIVSHRVTVD